MFSTIDKIATLRTAKAQAVLKLTPRLLKVLRSKTGPKGDALEIARAAGLLAAKKTPELIPHCHPIPLDQIAIDYEWGETEITVLSRVSAVWKTGVEMEALLAVQIVAVTLFDMLKPLDSNMEITGVKVLEKTGGKSDFREIISGDFKTAVIVTSDGTYSGKREDRSGRLIKERLENYGIANCDYRILPDERDEILKSLQEYYEKKFDLVITTGGTGLGPRDVTADVTADFIDRVIPGIMETARSFGQQRTPYSMLSRGVAGLKGNMVVVNLPGSSKGTKESLDAIFPALLHGYKMMRGEGH